jgi:hypothetical protein
MYDNFLKAFLLVRVWLKLVKSLNMNVYTTKSPGWKIYLGNKSFLISFTFLPITFIAWTWLPVFCGFDIDINFCVFLFLYWLLERKCEKGSRNVTVNASDNRFLRLSTGPDYQVLNIFVLLDSDWLFSLIVLLSFWERKKFPETTNFWKNILNAKVRFP